MEKAADSALGPEERRELARFSRAISLAEGFAFHIVVADTRRVAGAALAEVFADIIRIRAESQAIRWIRPDSESYHDADDFAFLILSQLEQALGDGDARPIVLDAIETTRVEEKGWRRVFQNLNEQRNRIVCDLQRALILCVSPPLERAFGHEAPDFWSIRGSGMRLHDRTPPAPPRRGTDRTIRLGVKTSRGSSPDKSTIEAQEARVAEARVGGSPRALAIELSRLATLYRAARQPEKALPVISEAVEIRRQLAASDAGVLQDLASALDLYGTVLNALGRREKTLNTIREAIEAYRLSDSSTSLIGLAESLGRLGDALSAMGHEEQALSATRESADTYRRLAEARPDAFLPELTGSLINLGSRLNDLGRREQALEAITEAVELRRQLAASRPNDFLPELAHSLRHLSHTLEALGRYDQAFSADREADEILHALAEP
jgi:tetratricopeptide (TPR) repeat protein